MWSEECERVRYQSTSSTCLFADQFSAQSRSRFRVVDSVCSASTLFFSDRMSKFHVGVLNSMSIIENSCRIRFVSTWNYKKWEDNITGINLITYIALGSLKANSLRSRVGSEPSFVKLHEIHICMVSSHLSGWQRKWSIKVISSWMQAVFEDTTLCNPSLSKRAWTFLPWLFHSVGSLNNLTITNSLLYLISKHILERNPIVHMMNM